MSVRSARASRPETLRGRLRKATSEAILSAAEETLVERGLESTGISEIAARAGVAVGTLYNHFEDREALLAALIADRGRELMQRLENALENSAKSPFRARLERLAIALLEHREAHYRLFEVVFDERACPRAPQPRPGPTMLRQIHGRIAQVMQQGLREGVLRRDGAELYAAVFLGMMKGMSFELSQSPSRGPARPPILATKVTRLFLEGAATR